MNDFINRKEELNFLKTKWDERKAHLIIIYGKRRVGKTELIKQFIKNKNALYFLADKRTTQDQLKELGQLFGQHFNDEMLLKNGFSEWLDVFRYLRKNLKKPLIFAIDEYPYLCETDKSVSSLFQKGWDEYLKEIPIFMILSGSSIAMMESETLSYKAPLYGRRSGQILIKPLNFYQSWKFFKGTNFDEFIELYTLTGGMPAYLLEISSKKTPAMNLKEKILDRKEFLFGEVEFILREELREPRTYLSLLKAISWGKTKAGEIINETGIEKTHLHKYLGILEELHLIEREVPVTEKNSTKSKRGLYKISDNFLKVWFHYVYPFKSNLEIGNFTEALAKFKTNFGNLVSLTYEQICKEIIQNHRTRLFTCEKIGRWWDAETEIDLVGFSSDSKKIFFGECKWSNKPIGTNILQDLVEKSKKIDWNNRNRENHYVLFSKSGFTEDLHRVAKNTKNIHLFHKDQLMH